MSKISFSGRLGIQQRVIPAYRAPFFDLLARSCSGGLTVFAGQPLPIESITTTENLDTADYAFIRNWHFSNPQSTIYLCWQAGVVERLELHDPTALIVEANPRYLSTGRAVHWMKQRGRPVLGWGLGAPRGGNSVERFFRTNFLQSLDGVIAYSQRGADEYRALGLENVFVAHNAVAMRPQKPPPVRLLSQEGQSAVLFVGRLQERKRIDILLRGCASLPIEQQPNLTIVGDGPATSALQSLAAEVYPRAKFVGAKYGSQLAPFYAAADLFALPGTGGLAVQEAMSYALPVIVAQGDGTQDDLVRQENGWQVPPGDQQAFNSALGNALSDITRLRRMGAKSYRIVDEEINLETMVESFIKSLTAVIGKK